MKYRLTYVGLSGILVTAGMLMGGVAHAADETVVTGETTVIAESSANSTSTIVTTSADSSAGNSVASTQLDSVTSPTKPTDKTAPTEALLSVVAAPETTATPTPISEAPTPGAAAHISTPVLTGPSVVVNQIQRSVAATLPAAVWQAIQQVTTEAAETGAQPLATTPIQPKPILPPAGSLQLTGVWGAVTLPILSNLTHAILASRADSYPIALFLLVILTATLGMGFVSFLKLSGYAHAARSDAAATNFATPSLNVSLNRAVFPI